jgi:hypothetical protein
MQDLWQDWRISTRVYSAGTDVPVLQVPKIEI